MSDFEKLQLKFELQLGLKSLTDIQQWAIKTLEEQLENKTALELCFISEEYQLRAYFDGLIMLDFDSEIINSAVYKTLQQFIVAKQNESSISENQLNHFIQAVWSITQYSTNDELILLASSYDDELQMLKLGYKQIEMTEIFNNLIVDLKPYL